jgi:hypothetical protein
MALSIRDITMDDHDSEPWPSQDEEAPESEAPSEPEDGTVDGNASPDPLSEFNDEGKDEDTSSADASTAGGLQLPAPEAWTLPIRAAPVLALQGETVVEFPLSQHVSGHESTSVVMDKELMRIVEARYDPDGVRRLNVRMALVKEHISGYSHTHLDMFQKLQSVWWASIGFGLLFATSLFQGALALGGGMFVLAGVAGLLMMKLDLHRLSFSDHGGRHDFYLSGWRQDPYLLHNSTALLGPAFVEFLRTGELETAHIEGVLDTMAVQATPTPALTAPPQPTEPKVPAQLPAPINVDEPALPNPEPSPLPEPVPPASFPPTPAGPPTSSSVEPMLALPPPPAPVASSTESMPALPPPPALVASSTESMPALPPPPAPVASLPPPPSAPMPPPPAASPALPPAPLPPAPLPPPTLTKAEVDEEALWGDLA